MGSICVLPIFSHYLSTVLYLGCFSLLFWGSWSFSVFCTFILKNKSLKHFLASPDRQEENSAF